MIEVECEVLLTFRNVDGESFVRVRQLYGESWYYSDNAELAGCPLAPLAPWVEYPHAPEDFVAFLEYDFHLLRPDDIGCFATGSKVLFKPGVRRVRS